MAFQLQFAGLTLDDVAELFEESPSRVHIDLFPRREGGVGPEVALRAPKTFRLTGQLIKDSESALDTYLQNLKQKLNAGVGQLVIKDNNRYATVIKKDFGIMYRAGELPTRAVRFFIDLVAPDPFFYSTTESTSGVSTISASPQSFTVTNNGGVYCHPKIEVKAVGADKTNVKLSNTTNGQYVQFTGTIVNGQTLIFDCVAQKVTNGAQNGLASFLGDSKLSLMAGANNLLYEGPASGVEVTVKHVARWD